MKLKKRSIKKIPRMFRPLLWSFRWDALNINTDKEDVIVNTINDGNLKHWHWIIKTYGTHTIRKVLQKRLATEFHPESLNLARVVFHLKPLHHAR